MDAGALRHLVIFEEPVSDLDSDGAQELSWVAAFPAPLRASITTLTGRELIAAQAISSKVSTRIVVRYRPGIDARLRAIHRDTVYNIEAVIPDPESGRRWVTLLCSSGVNEG